MLGLGKNNKKKINMEPVDNSKIEGQAEEVFFDKEKGQESVQTEELLAVKEDKEMGKQAAAQYLFMAFEGDHVYINPDTNDIVVSYITSSDRAIDVQGWSVPENNKAKLCAKDEYKVEVDMRIPKESGKKGSKKDNPRKDAATEDLRTKFKAEIEAAKELLAAGNTGNKDVIEESLKSPLCGSAEPEKLVSKEPEVNISAINADALEKFKSELISKMEQLSKDMANSGEDTTEAVSREINSSFERLFSAIKKSGENAGSVTKETETRIVQEIKSESSDLISRIQTEVKKNHEELLKGTKSIQRKVEKIDEICEATQMMENKYAKLDQLETIASILSEKGIEISRDFPPTCGEEEDIINLVRYSKKITEQLGYAARELIRKKAHYESKEQNLANEQAVTEKKISDAHSQGIAEGRLFVLKALLSKYADVDTIIESESNHVHVLWPFMQELDVTIDGGGAYKKGTVLELSEEDVEKMVAIYKNVDGAGKYRVIKTGLTYGNEIIFKAEFEKVSNEETHIEPETTTVEGNNEQTQEVSREETTGDATVEETREETVSYENGENTKAE